MKEGMVQRDNNREDMLGKGRRNARGEKIC